MTDLERARALLREGELGHRDMTIADALAAARREGAEAEAHRAKIIRELDIAAFRAALHDMRERAAQEVNRLLGLGEHVLADAIRALPLTPEEPNDA